MDENKNDKKNEFPPELARKIELLTEGSFTETQKKAFEEIRRLTEPFEKYHKEYLRAYAPDSQLVSSFSSIIAANNSTIALFRESIGGQVWWLEMADMHRSWTEKFAPLQSMIEEMKAAVALDFASIAKNLTLSESITRVLSEQNVWGSLGISSLILKQLQTDDARLSESMKSLVDTIRMPKDYLGLPHSSIVGASREIFASSYAIGTLFPSIQKDVPFDLIEEERQAREDTDNCAELLELVNPDFVPMYHGALDALRGSSRDKPRQVMISLRELCMHLLHWLAPDDEVKSWLNPNDKTLLVDGKPTRKARALYICRNVGHGDLKAFVDHDTKALVTLFEVLNDVHKINSQLTDSQLSALMLRSQSQIVYMINIWKETQ